MKIAVTGSIATDHLMHFPGKFAHQFIEDKIDKVSLSFLVDDLVLRRGGIASNICFGMAQLGLSPMLVGAVGKDFFDDYAGWLSGHGVDVESVYVSDTAHTARFVCTTDEDMCQIGSFYAGAMAESSKIDLAPVHERSGGLDLVLVSANDPAAMVRHSAQCRELGIPFAADPSQQLARLDGDGARELIEGAKFLLTNEYEKELLENKTGLTHEQILDKVQVRVTTLGKDGVEIVGRGLDRIHVPVAREINAYDPTGVGDGFRAGFFAALSWGLTARRAAEVGSLLATLVLETVGTQEYLVDPTVFIQRLGESYGPACAAEVSPHVLKSV
ncbi:MAG TPA: carbohydrate kinase family protein [Stackebrandtia sp.]|jgi:adenosine kinase|uniref:carbohydrate kinase family protein n=1 Tax=Stackebrandtia sp. TaxID=2023065 RepID=UPI002D2EF1C1|nr:carbohydrate kinase family protein [Stackebrandtia sp.]HZE41223.1 carbohydrate kinase family protein [Stackebrandtia sp.]